MWVRVDDGFPEHHKVLTAAEHLGVNGAGRVGAIWLEVMCYSNRHLTDGFISETVARRLHFDRNPVEVLRAMSLKSVGLLERIEGGWQVHDYHDYQPSKKEVEKRRRKERNRKRRVRADKSRTPKAVRDVSARRPRKVAALSADPDPARSDPARSEDRSDQEQREDAHRALVRLAHLAIDERGAVPGPADPLADLGEVIKGQAAKAHIPYDGTAVQKALESAIAQRRRSA